MGSVSRRTFLVTGSAGALGAAGVASGVLRRGGGGSRADGSSASPTTALTTEEVAQASIPMMLHVRDVEAGEVGVLVDEREVVFTDKALVAKLLRAAN
jgi:hypothetical protein